LIAQRDSQIMKDLVEAVRLHSGALTMIAVVSDYGVLGPNILFGPSSPALTRFILCKREQTIFSMSISTTRSVQMPQSPHGQDLQVLHVLGMCSAADLLDNGRLVLAAKEDREMRWPPHLVTMWRRICSDSG
jgi:hypothetical protein